MSSDRVRQLFIVALVGLSCCWAGCKSTITDAVLVPVGVAEAQQLVQGKKRMMGLAGSQTGAWVDSRTEADYKAGHIPGAIHLPYERVSLDYKTLESFDVIVIYGNDYNDVRANGMSKRLIELGFADVRTLTGGMRAWKTEGNTVEKGE